MAYWDKKTYDELINVKDVVKKIESKVGVGGQNSSTTLATKQPLNTLKFKKLLDRPVMGLSYHDGRYYVLDENATVQVYENVVNDSVPIETGVTIPLETGQNIAHFEVLGGGIVVSRNNTNDGSCSLLYSPDINTPFSVPYTSPDDTEIHSFTQTFGMSTYDNGQHGLVLVGVYGRGVSEKDLLLSTDSGETYTVVNKTRIIEPIPYNSHWHDVEIDPYHGFLWASQGDGEGSRRIIFSRDLGVTWETLIENTDQPTSITAFPNRVTFGRDGKGAGIDTIIKPSLIGEEVNFTPQLELQNVPGQEYYAHSPLKHGNEGYIAFSIFEGLNPAMVWGTGDFGETWHGVHFGDRSGTGFIDRLIEIDNEHVFALGSNWGGGLNTLYYSDKINWE